MRRAVIRSARLAGPFLGMGIAVCIGGLGLHAARDWHRHGEIGAGFFHLHFHVGDHEHEGRHHQHPGPYDDDHDAPGHEPRRHTAVLTIANAVFNVAPATPVICSPDFAPDRAPDASVILPESTIPWSSVRPRAPPA